MKSEIQQKLETLAFNRTTPFCYGCYIQAPKGICPECHSDDLMRHLDGVGVEWGTSWCPIPRSLTGFKGGKSHVSGPALGGSKSHLI